MTRGGGLQARFTEAILRDKAHISSLSDRIFSTAETGHPKSNVLVDLEKQHPGTEYHFVEDKLGTLEKVRLPLLFACLEACPALWRLPYKSKGVALLPVSVPGNPVHYLCR